MVPEQISLGSFQEEVSSKGEENFHDNTIQYTSTQTKHQHPLTPFSAQIKSIPFLFFQIVIVIDGADMIQGNAAQRGQLHWLPTDIPACARFILSTVEFDKTGNQSKSGGFRHLHRTFTELNRRKCTTVRLESLGVEVRHGIINAFTSKFQQVSAYA